MWRLRIWTVLLVFSQALLVGCAGLGASQQSRLERGESARIVMVRPQGLFFASHVVRLDQRPDGVITVHSGPSPSVTISTQALSNRLLSDGSPVRLNEALVPFLFPSCPSY